MKLLFSEAQPDYDHYLYPYVIWAFLEADETPADAFEAGFMPATPDLDVFFMVRHVRVPIREWRPTSENRRILRKGEQVRCRLIPRAEFDYTEQKRAQWVSFAEQRFGPGIMTPERLDGLMGGPVISHLLEYRDEATGRELGTALMYLEAPRVAFYYYAFYDLDDRSRNAGLLMMTQLLEFGRNQGWDRAYLGTCVTTRALYKCQFEPLEFYNGMEWSRDVEELKRLNRVRLDNSHRLVHPEFGPGAGSHLMPAAAASPIRLRR